MKYGQHINRRISILCLSTAIVSSLGAPARAQSIVADGTVINVPVGTIVETSDEHGLHAYNGGKIIGDKLTVTTTGESADGVFVNRPGSTVTLTDTKITTEGQNASGVVVRQGGNLSIAGGTITANGGTISAIGVSVNGADSVASITDTTIIGGVSATRSASLTISGGSVTTTGVRQYGIEVADDNPANGMMATAKITDTDIITNGAEAIGVFAQGGSLTISGGNISTDGVSAAGFYAGSDDSIATVTDTRISTNGDNAHGVTFEYGASLTMNDGGVHTYGDKSYGVRAYGVHREGIATSVSLTNTAIYTEGENAHGAVAEKGAILSLNAGTIGTVGASAHGVYAMSGGRVELHPVPDTGTGASTMTGIWVYGKDSNGINVTENALVSADGTHVRVVGNGAGVSASDGGRVDLARTDVTSTTGAALKTQSGEGTFNLTNGTSVVGKSGILFSGAAGTSSTINADGEVTLIGDMVVDQTSLPEGGTLAAGTLQADLKNGSYWAGAASGVTGASIDGTSNWYMKGSSDVGTLSNNGIIVFDATNSYKTLTAGSLVMNGGSFVLNTELNEGGAASKTDRIVVTGDATGNGLIKIRNNGGTGAHTGTGATDGIQIVQIGGASDAEFKLGSAAIVGIYDYQLKKADGQNWYLQTDGKDVVNPPVDPVDPVDPKPPVDPVDPGNPVAPVDPVDPVTPPVNPGPGTGTGTGHVVDIVPGYNIALSAAQNHVLTSLDTFHERLSELRSEDLNDGYHAWMRGIGKTGSYSPNSVTGYNGHGFDMTTAGVQIGADYSKSDVFVVGDKFTVGIFGEYANSNFDVRGRTADGSISSKGLGGYVTWQQKAPTDRKPGTGVYVDAVVKQDWLDFGVNAKSVSGFDLHNGYKGKATSASIETGYGFDLGNNVILQPSAQLTWSKVKADSFTDPYGIAVNGQEAESLIGRIGMRLEKTIYFGEEAETMEAAKTKFVQSVTTFADVNVKQEFKGKNRLVASNNGIGNDMGGTRYDVGAGVVARMSENVSLFGRGSVEAGGSTNVAGKASGGLKITW